MAQIKLPLDFLAGLDLLEGISKVHKFGRNSDIDTGDVPEDIWDAGDLWVAPTQARLHNIVSTETTDAEAGTGAQTVKIYGLDSDYNEVSETVTLNGTTNVATTNTYTRIYRMKVMSVGSGGSNTGNITATAQTDATVTAQISAGYNQTLMAVYTVPSGYTALMVKYYVSLNRPGVAAGAMADIVLQLRSIASGVWLTKQTIGIGVDGSGTFVRQYAPLYKIEEKTDVRMQVEYVSDSNSDVSGGFDMYLIKNTMLDDLDLLNY